MCVWPPPYWGVLKRNDGKTRRYAGYDGACIEDLLQRLANISLLDGSGLGANLGCSGGAIGGQDIAEYRMKLSLPDPTAWLTQEYLEKTVQEVSLQMFQTMARMSSPQSNHASPKEDGEGGKYAPDEADFPHASPQSRPASRHRGLRRKCPNDARPSRFGGQVTAINVQTSAARPVSIATAASLCPGLWKPSPRVANGIHQAPFRPNAYESCGRSAAKCPFRIPLREARAHPLAVRQDPAGHIQSFATGCFLVPASR